jgi:transketolase
MDAVQQANSGHPGAPMGMADIAEVLWNDFYSHNPAHPQWYNRDRFVLSNGHASMLIYSLLHLSGYDLSMDDLKNFRQMGSKTPGHPEYGYTPGIETTTGPLGQGLTNAVGMALAEKVLAAQFNRPELEIVDHYTWTFLGDGCLMEGISHEAASLAGTLGLGKLIAFYDENGISIDGDIQGWFKDDTPARFEAYGWQVIRAVDGHDPVEIKTAIESARACQDKPTLICCRTVIGKGAPSKQGSHDCHGAPLGASEIEAARVAMKWSAPAFEIPQPIYQAWDAKQAGADKEAAWNALFANYQAKHPELAKEFERRMQGQLPAQFSEKARGFIQAVSDQSETLATRVASRKALDFAGPLLPELLGGSADLTPSNNTFWSGSKDITPTDYSGNYLRYGVREFGMAAMMNGMALHGGVIPYAGTFLVFSDYARNAMRMAALMKIRAIYVLTHDSIGLGEDGPTHQPVEHVASLRLIPNMTVWRPCDATETAVAWQDALERVNGPTSLILTRQNLSPSPRTPEQLSAIRRGGYVLSECEGTPEVILIATGSEVALVMGAAEELRQEGKRVRVVSMPCCEVFEQQDEAWRESVLPRAVAARLVVEAGRPDGWYRYVGFAGKVIGMTTFGESAPADQLFKHFGFTIENVTQAAREIMG